MNKKMNRCIESLNSSNFDTKNQILFICVCLFFKTALHLDFHEDLGKFEQLHMVPLKALSYSLLAIRYICKRMATFVSHFISERQTLTHSSSMSFETSHVNPNDMINIKI